MELCTSGASEHNSSQHRPFFGQVFPSFSPRSSGAGGSGDEVDWTMAEEKILRDIASWLSPADLRRARLVCKSWCGALATLATKATTPPEVMMPQWKGQLEALILAYPCLHELTISSRISIVAAQQLGVLAAAKQLRVLNIPHGQALQDRSLMALQPLAPNLQVLRITGAAGLSKRSLLLLSVLGNLEVLELKNCGKVSWFELQQAWKAACAAHEAQASAEAAAAGMVNSSSGGGSSGSGGSSSGGGLSSRLGAWLPTGRLFRTSSPSSNSIQSAVAWQRSGAGNLFAKVHDFARSSSSAAAVAVAQRGVGAIGNGRSSCGGAMQEGAARKLLYSKQKIGAAAARSVSSTACEAAADPEASTIDSSFDSSSIRGCLNLGGPLLSLRTKSAMHARDSDDSPRPASMLSRVGLLWQSGSGEASTADGSSSSNSSGSSSSLSIAAQTSCVQAALLAYLAEEEQAAAAVELGLQLNSAAATGASSVSPQANATVPAEANTTSSSSSLFKAANPRQLSTNTWAGSTMQPPPAAAAPAYMSQQISAPAAASSTAEQPAKSTMAFTAAPLAAAPSGSRFKPRRRTSGDKNLPAMPFTKLNSLSFTCSDVMLKNPGQELAAVAALTSLTCLEVSKCKLPDTVFANLRSLNRLAKLKISGLWSMGDAGLSEIAQLTTLKSLALSEAMHVTGQGLQALSRLSQLTSLAVGLTQDVTPGSLARVANSLLQLQCLEIAAPSWDDLDCEILAEAVSTSAAAAVQQSAVLASAASAPAPSPKPQMLWELTSAMSGGSVSRHSSTKQLLSLPGPLSLSSSRSNSSINLRAPSFGSCGSFGSFSIPAFSQSQGAGAAAQQQQQLLVLRLHGCRALTSRGLAALKQLPQLQTLVLDNCQEVHASEAVSQGLLPPKLASLALRALPFGNLFSGCVSVPACSGLLTKLELASMEGTHDGQLRRLLGFFPNLVELSLVGCADLGDEAVMHLQLLPKLQQVNLGGTSITGQTFEHLRQLLELRVMSLKGCNQLTDVGLGQLLALTALEELDVSDVGSVSEQGLQQVMRGVKQLVRLDACGCKGVTAALVACCPHYLCLRHSL